MDQMKNIAEAYEEISIINIKKTRKKVVGTRDFLDSVRDVYLDVKYSHDALLGKLNSEQASKSDAHMKGAKKLKTRPLAMLLTPNAKMYGDIVRQVFDEFYEFVKDRDVDIAVVGRLGYEMLNELDPNRKPLFFELPDAGVSSAELKPILFNLLEYETVSVFHGRYQTVITQMPTVSYISGKDVFIDKDIDKVQEAKSHHSEYLFEPSLEEISSFFGDQFFSVVFKQAYHESQLAQFASRLRAMESALDQVGEDTKKLQRASHRFRRREQSKQQTERLAGIMFFKKG